MCGISGYFSRLEDKRYSKELSESMRSQSHRGPDHSGLWEERNIGFAHSRLAIIDLKACSNQPMTLAKSKLTIVFNGEIYNFKLLKKELSALGCIFKTESDTELILHAYEKWGVKAFDLFNGMFAFAIYDNNKEELILARDRYGIKPLYHYVDDQNCFFASELGGVLSFPIQRKLNQNSLLNYFRYSYIPNHKSIIQSVDQIKPGHYKIISRKQTKEECYYSLATDRIDVSYDDAINEIKRKVELSVDRRLLADVPVATFLSSGIDSSVITYIASAQKPGIAAYSAGFSEFAFFDESKMAQKWSESIKVDHHIVDLREKDLLNSVSELLNTLSEPFADSSSIAYYLLSKQVAKDMKVVLSGDGADELFGGYRKHKAEWMRRENPTLHNLAAKLRPFFNEFQGGRSTAFGNAQRQLSKWVRSSALSNEDRYMFMASMVSHEELSDLLIKKDLEGASIDGELDSINAVLKQDISMVLPGDMLYKVDRTSMAHGLEVRVPFLDHELVDYVFSLPSEWKLKNGKRKNLLKDAFAEILPDEIINRKKRGFEVPIRDWLKGPLRSLVNEVLNEKTIQEQGVLNSEEVNRIIERSRSKKEGNTPYLVWALLVFQHWMNEFKPSL